MKLRGGTNSSLLSLSRNICKKMENAHINAKKLRGLDLVGPIYVKKLCGYTNVGLSTGLILLRPFRQDQKCISV